ncbi:allophanate hydrolase, partial [Chloroflexota bacterium]
RIGYRFYSEGFAYTWIRQERGEAQHFGAGKDPCNTILIPYPVGSIQTDMKNGAIVVLQDSVSVGGFVTIGTVIQSDQDVLAQAKPGHLVKFIPISREQALSVRKEKREMLNRIKESCLNKDIDYR